MASFMHRELKVCCASPFCTATPLFCRSLIKFVCTVLASFSIVDLLSLSSPDGPFTVARARKGKKKEPRASEKRSSGRHKKPRPIGFPTAGLRAIQALRLWGPVREALGPPRRCSLVPGPKQEGRRQRRKCAPGGSRLARSLRT